jgi:hypothetical protein
MIDNKCSLVASVALIETPQPATLVSRRNQSTTRDVFLEFVDQRVWNTLVESVNRGLFRGPRRHDNRRKPTSAEELIRFYGIIVALESSYGNSMRNLKKHFASIKSTYGNVPRLGQGRFSALLSAFAPSIEEIKNITNILHENFERHIENVSLITIDESVIGYQPSARVKRVAEASGEPIPVVFIPRKPHPNGLLLYQAVTYVASPISRTQVLPYIVDILPHLEQGDYSPAGAFVAFLSRWSKPTRPHFVADAAFGSLELVKKISEWGGKATLSFNINNNTWLWNCLTFSLPPGHWRAAIHELGCISSCNLR